MSGITPEQFAAVVMRVGTIVEAQPFPEARKPSLKLIIDFGAPVGTRRSSAQLTRRYTPDALIGRQVIAVVNLPPRRIAGFESEVLVLGAVPEQGDVILLAPDQPTPNGSQIA